ncbi:hypothetical protein MESS2_1710002 [Mesorhizobium metallidurans STM 2683]|uniref:Uncharacterized protein n=1 Tax=Mesorhizobium metallidurans STM 2683 TaxID=1297569 RepID=M5EP23_9HYPH|nr:hypothetical protein MESS2_1710002 [Mesorhizobium metallidurans STM 2683]
MTSKKQESSTEESRAPKEPTSSEWVRLDRARSVRCDTHARHCLRFCHGCEQQDGCRSTHWSFDGYRRRLAPEAILHMDATQVVGRIPIDLTDEFVEVDLLSLSAHKSTARKAWARCTVGRGCASNRLFMVNRRTVRRRGTLNS